MLAVAVPPVLVHTGPVVAAGSFVALWGPNGLRRSSRDVTPAATNGAIVSLVVAVGISGQALALGIS